MRKMTPNKYVIGFKFNKKMFRLESLKGSLMDAIIELRDKNKEHLNADYFTQIKTSTGDDNLHIILTDVEDENRLTISYDQFIYAKTSSNSDSSVSIERTIKEFELLWKTSNKILHFPSVRRIGFVVEYRVKEKSADSASSDLINAVLKFPTSGHSSYFNLRFEDRELNSSGAVPKKETADFWNKIYSFYNSDLDENPEHGKFNVNLDLQKYYNPAKSDPLKELMVVRNRLANEKKKLKDELINMGLIEG